MGAARRQHDTVSPLPVIRLDARAILPSRAHPGDAGLDLHALDELTLHPGQRAAVRTGIAVAIPAGHAGLITARSGLAARHGLALVNAPGLIDCGYRGELKVLLLNTDREQDCLLRAGDRIAQLVVVPIATPNLVEVTELDSTSRGYGGFGSTGGFGG
ncbi:MAG: dUTP diphosphatase [Solirubrobacteraceae bacterium]